MLSYKSPRSGSSASFQSCSSWPTSSHLASYRKATRTTLLPNSLFLAPFSNNYSVYSVYKTCSFLKVLMLRKKGGGNVMKSFSLCMCSVFLIGFEDLKVFSFSSFFPTFSLLFFLSYSFSLVPQSALHLLFEQSSVCRWTDWLTDVKMRSKQRDRSRPFLDAWSKLGPVLWTPGKPIPQPPKLSCLSPFLPLTLPQHKPQ